MGGLINNGQQFQISEQRRMPVDNVGSDELIPVTGETVQLQFYTAGVLGNDAGEAAGTVVVFKLANRNIKNALGDVTATSKDTSLSFTSTALTTEVPFPYLDAELFDQNTGVLKAAKITEGFSNGDYCVDYRTGAGYGVKASATTTLTSTAYKIEASTSITPPGAASEVELVDGSGNAIATTEDVASTLRGFNVFGTRADFDGAAFPTLADTEGDSISASRSPQGVSYVQITDNSGQGSAVVNENAGKGAVPTAVLSAGTVADFDGAAFPTLSDTEAKATSFAASQQGVQYVTLVNDDGSDYGQIKGYDTGTDSIKGFEVSPLSSHYVNESLVDTTNIAAAATYYPSSTGGVMDGYSDLSFTGKLIEGAGETVTFEVEMMNDEDTSGDWVPVHFYDDQNNTTTNIITCSNATTLIAVSLNNANFRRYRVVVTPDSATNTVIVKSRKKAL